ncbi:MAG: outer membrane protein [Arenicella sp.]|jgi:outer membrane protein
MIKSELHTRKYNHLLNWSFIMTKTTTKLFFIVIAILLSIASPASANSFIPHWSVDIGYVELAPNDESSEISGPGLPPGNGVNVRSASTIVGSVAYHFSKNISLQFYVAPPIAYDVDAAGSLDGVGKIAEVDVLLPTLFVNYTFDPILAKVKPYIGIGLNYTTFLSESPTPVLNGAFGGETDIKADDSFGVALQAGLGIDLNEKWYLNVGYVAIDVDSTVELTTEAVGTFRTVDIDIDPSGGYLRVGYRF